MDPHDELRRLCDERTLQEESRGFFKELVAQVEDSTTLLAWAPGALAAGLRGEAFLRELAQQEEIYEQMCGCFSVSEVFRGKSAEGLGVALEAAEAGLAGGGGDGGGGVGEALGLLGRVLVRAPPGPELDRALALRSQYLEHQPLPPPLTPREVELTGSEHSSLAGVSSLVEIREEIAQGRFAVAAGPVAAGSVLLCEKPYAACLNTKLWGSHCTHCFQSLKVPWACPDCAGMAFCSQECCEAALATYHCWECKFTSLFLGSGMSILCHIALRVVTQLSLSECLETCAAMKGEGGPGSRHATALHLVTHEDLRTPRDYTSRALMAFFLLRCLQKSGYFSKKIRNKLSDAEFSVWALLFHCIQALQFNVHSVSLASTGGPRDAGCALYANASLFNHHCCPPLARHFEGGQVVLRAIRAVRVGEHLADNYGPRFGREQRSGAGGAAGPGRNGRRRALAARYRFWCHCPACEEDWTDNSTIEPMLRCSKQECGGTLSCGSETEGIGICSTCGAVADATYVSYCRTTVKSAMENVEFGLELAADKSNKAQGVLQSALNVWHGVAHLPCMRVLKAEDVLDKLLSTS